MLSRVSNARVILAISAMCVVMIVVALVTGKPRVVNGEVHVISLTMIVLLSILYALLFLAIIATVIQRHERQPTNTEKKHLRFCGE
jgi:uncharacterized membrane protein